MTGVLCQKTNTEDTYQKLEMIYHTSDLRKLRNRGHLQEKVLYKFQCRNKYYGAGKV